MSGASVVVDDRRVVDVQPCFACQYLDGHREMVDCPRQLGDALAHRLDLRAGDAGYRCAGCISLSDGFGIDLHDDSSSAAPGVGPSGDESTVEDASDTSRCGDSRRGVSAGGAA